MKRDWDVIREVLIAVEGLDPKKFEKLRYSIAEDDEKRTAEHATLLWKYNFLEGVNAGSMSGACVLATGLTWEGHEMLETMRSKPVWERIKATAQEKGVELTFDTVKVLGGMALSAVLGS